MLSDDATEKHLPYRQENPNDATVICDQKSRE